MNQGYLKTFKEVVDTGLTWILGWVGRDRSGAPHVLFMIKIINLSHNRFSFSKRTKTYDIVSTQKMGPFHSTLHFLSSCIII
jgi:hypothetical protein